VRGEIVRREADTSSANALSIGTAGAVLKSKIAATMSARKNDRLKT
jgi:hypothetical protein